MIIGIGGISNSGKSKLAAVIKEHYPDKKVCILCQDDFAMLTADIPKIKGHTNWEIPESINFNRYYSRIINESKENDIVISEGLFVFYEPRFVKLYDKMIYLSISKDTFYERKKQDFRWGKEPDWYMDHIWDSHFEFCNKIAIRNHAFQLSGENPVDIEKVFAYLETEDN